MSAPQRFFAILRAASACENPVHIFKSSRYAAMRAGDGAGTLADAALRAAEGCLVLAEEGLAASWGLGPQDAPLAFAPGALEDEVARLDADPEARAAALTRQEALPWAAPAPGALAAWLKGADRRAREAGWPPVLAYADPARKFVVYGWIGANNYGDDLLLRTAIDKVSRRWPNARFVCMGADAATLERDFGVEATDPVPGRALDLALTGASAVICLGGLIFDDPSQRTEGAGEFALRPHAEPGFQATMALSARIRGVPTVYMSLGSGPMSDPAVQAALRLHALAGTLFLPRDEETRRMLVAGGADPSRVRLRSDIVLAAGGYVRATAAAEPPHGLAPGSYFAVALRAWPRAPRDLAASMAALIAEAARQSGLMPVLVPFDADDARIHAEVAALLEARGAACLDLPERLAEPDLLALLMGSAFGVSMRLHASIIHHLLGKPALGVDYNSKVGAYFRRMGQQDVLVPMDVDGEGCARSVSALLGDAQGRAAAVAEAAAHARELADEAFEDLFRAVEGGFAGVPTPLPQETACYPRLGSALERDLAFERDRASALDASLAAERARAEAAEARVRDLEGSHSYRLGRAITAVPARVRDALRGR